MRRRTRDAFSTLSENLDGKERPLAGALQVPVRYVFFVLAALLLLFGVHTYRESTRSPPPDHVVRLLPTSYEDRSRLRRLLSTNRSEVRLGLVTLTQGSRSLGMWLRHHYWHCGVRRVYLQIERGSADLRVLRRAPWTELVQIVPLGQQPVVVRNYAQQMDRQAPPPNAAFTAFAPSASTPSRHTHSARSTNCHNRPQSTRLPQLPQSHRVHIALPRRHPAPLRRQAALMAQAMVLGQKDGLSHLMTIDDDELLFCPAGCAALHAALAAAPEPALVLHNLEALAPAADQLVTDWRARGVASFFGRSVAFRHNTSSYAGYRHGKAVGALRRGLKPAGCCRFSRRQVGPTRAPSTPRSTPTPSPAPTPAPTPNQSSPLAPAGAAAAGRATARLRRGATALRVPELRRVARQVWADGGGAPGERPARHRHAAELLCALAASSARPRGGAQRLGL